MSGKKKVLITGGLGNLGSWITQEFCKNNYDIYVLTRKETYKIENLEYTIIEVDITNIDSLHEKLDIDFDYCIHTASFNEHFVPFYHLKAMEINVLGTRNLLKVLSSKNLKKFIYFSTFHVYGAREGFIDESTILKPKNDYALTHLFAEYYVQQICESNNINYTIFRLTNSYGCPINKKSDKWYLVLNDLTKSAYIDNKIILNSNGKALRDFIWMGDVANVTLKALPLDKSEIYNLSSMKNYQIIDIAKIVQEVYQLRYQKNIKIITNCKDKSASVEFKILNKKLQSDIDFKLNIKITEEINKIFDLLEGV
jgi:UDP-glucose 4-epimerase